VKADREGSKRRTQLRLALLFLSSKGSCTALEMKKKIPKPKKRRVINQCQAHGFYKNSYWLIPLSFFGAFVKI
jgi:hypothetical protein